MTEGSVVATYFGLQAMLAIATRSLWLPVLRTYGAWVVGLPMTARNVLGTHGKPMACSACPTKCFGYNGAEDQRA